MAYRRRYFATEYPVTTQVLAPDAITSDKIATGAVLGKHIKDGEVTSADIKDGTIGLEDLGPTVPAIGIADGSITEAKLANDAVATAKVKDGAITSGKLGTGAVTVTKIGDNAVESAKIKNEAVVPAKIQDGAVTPAKASSGFGRYVPRKAVTEDKVKADFTLDGNWHADGLDLSGIIPAGAIGVVLQLKIISDTVGDVLIISNDQVAYPVCEGRIEACVADTTLVKHIVLPCEANRLFDYVGYGFAGVADVWVTVLGWFI